jgi:cyclopropane-fatty-acyl-phospholipid synthase
MSERVTPSDAQGSPTRALERMAPFARRFVRSKLSGLEHGTIELEEGGTTERLGAQGAPIEARLVVRDPRFWSRLALRGDLGAAESWMLGEWDSPDLVSLIRIFAREAGLASRLAPRAARWLRALERVRHWRRRNTRSGSRRNIEAHYDLGNEFFELFLDPTLTYSCALFEAPGQALESAQTGKYDRICRKLELGPGDEVLEIGTGWGGFALHAASRYGCNVTTTTISPEQQRLASARVRSAGLEGRVRVLRQDYRELRGQYDKLVSIEMIEAVGHRFLDAFFHACSERLKPHGMMLLQAILIPDPVYRHSVRSVDFIKRYIFPGGQLPSLGAICAAVARGTDLQLVHVEEMGAHYAETLRRWRERFRDNRARIEALGFGEGFVRMWEFYLQYCEGGFLERAIGVAQIALAKPLCRRQPLLGALEPPAAGRTAAA